MLWSSSSIEMTEFVILTLFSLTTVIVSSLLSLYIPVVEQDNTFIPQGVDYLRTVILASGTALLLNYLYRFVDVMLIYCKVWLEFLALLLLAYPQRTTVDSLAPNARWNLVKRQGYLFGVCYQAIYLAFYLWDLWFVELDEEQLSRLVKDDIDENLHQKVIQKSTLSNCIEFRRKSSSLKKVIYSTEYQPRTVPNETNDLLKDDIISYQSDALGSSSNSRYDPALDEDSPGHTCSMTAVVSRNSIPGDSKGVDPRWILENCAWIIITTLYEIGISLILSISFIYVPEMDDSLFTLLERFFYNKTDIFCVSVVIPLFIITSLVQILLHLSTKPGQRRRTFGIFALVCTVIFGFAMIAT